MRRTLTAALMAAAGCFAIGMGVANAATDNNPAAVKALSGARISLQQALRAGERTGRPISAKFEVENGKPQLSIYTAKEGGFSEVLLDRRTGAVVRAEPITGGDDLTHAQAQAQAMNQAKLTLRQSVARAVNANPGYRALSVEPAQRDGHPVAMVVLAKGGATKLLTERLD